MTDKKSPKRSLLNNLSNKNKAKDPANNMPTRRNITLLIALLFLIAITAGMLNSTHTKVNTQVDMPESTAPQNVMVEAIIDVSGSMWGQIQGISKIDNSREIFGTVLKDLPPNVKLGLRTFGGRNESRLEVPIGLENREEMEQILRKLRPNGKSPIGYALEQAGSDLLHQTGEKYILLISDGIDNGQIDPVAKAAELHSAGVTIHVVFVRNRGAAGEEKLQAIAKAGGGRYFTYSEKELLVPTMTLIR